MTGAFARIVGWLRPQSDADRPKCRLTENEALEIAARAAPPGVTLVVLRVTQSAGGFDWVIGTPTKGSGYTVRLDDATGDIIESGRWGKR